MSGTYVPLPQADNPGLIMAVVRRIAIHGFNRDDLSQNALPGYVSRQVDYYGDAAISLGLLNSSHILTTDGKHFVSLSGDEAIAFFIKCMEHFLEPDELMGYASGTTLMRRQASIDAWELFVSLPFDVQCQLCDPAEWRYRRSYVKNEPKRDLCTNCFMPIPPAFKECPECN